MEFDQFVEDAGRRLTKLAWLLVTDKADAEDVVQDTLIALFRHWGRVQAAEYPEAYARTTLVRIARRYNVRNRRRRDRPAELPAPVDLEPVSGFGQARLQQCLAQLSARQREAVVLRHVLDMSVEDTSRAMRCPTGAVKSQTSKGLQRLRELLASHLDNHENGRIPT